MNSFKIKEIYANGYERWAKVKMDGCSNEVIVHFLEYDEYLENEDSTNKRSMGDVVNGTIKIALATNYKIVDTDKNGYIQLIDNYSNITAFGMVKKIEDSDAIVCSINNLCDDIVIEFENDIKINIGENIEVNGSLELEIE